MATIQLHVRGAFPSDKADGVAAVRAAALAFTSSLTRRGEQLGALRITITDRPTDTGMQLAVSGGEMKNATAALADLTTFAAAASSAGMLVYVCQLRGSKEPMTVDAKLLSPDPRAPTIEDQLAAARAEAARWKQNAQSATAQLLKIAQRKPSPAAAAQAASKEPKQ
jgi:hypothetical protein